MIGREQSVTNGTTPADPVVGIVRARQAGYEPGAVRADVVRLLSVLGWSHQERGPFGAVADNGKWTFKFRQKDPGQWRGVVDLSPAVSAALDHNGRERVRLYYKDIPRHAHRTTRTEFRRMLAER